MPSERKIKEIFMVDVIAGLQMSIREVSGCFGTRTFHLLNWLEPFGE